MTSIVIVGSASLAAMLGLIGFLWSEPDRSGLIKDAVKSLVVLAFAAWVVYEIHPGGWFFVFVLMLYVAFAVASVVILAPLSLGLDPGPDPDNPNKRAIHTWVWAQGPLRVAVSRFIRWPRRLHGWLVNGGSEGSLRIVWWRGLLAILLVLTLGIPGVIALGNNLLGNDTTASGTPLDDKGSPVIMTGWYQAFDSEAQRKNALEAAFCAKLIDEETFESFANGGTPGDRDRSELFEFFQTMTSSADNRGPQYSGVLKVIVGGNPNLIQSGPEGRDVINPEVVDPDDLKPGDTPVLSTIEVPQAWTFTPGAEGEPFCKLTPVPAGVYYFDPVRKDLSTSLTGGLLMTTGDNLERWRVFTTNPAG